ncbi:MAG: hypothetical protein IPK50_03430 [Fibrobacterota bacterium]|nr:MAG: hypothetical protein IPK50_03430 [Fibrobacterota bacterium]
MKPDPSRTRSTLDRTRPLAFEEGLFEWNLRRISPTLPDGQPHPARRCGVFSVHGMGRSECTEAAAQIRSGIEDAQQVIAEWQAKNGREKGLRLPAPFLLDGFWADYQDLSVHFPEDWQAFCEREKSFFASLWAQRVVSPVRTAIWFLRQQIRLLAPRVLWEVGVVPWLFYWMMFSLTVAGLIWSMLRARVVLSRYLNDVRLYLDPRGDLERAAVQRIDERVSLQFLRMIGLDRDFRPLPSEEWLEVGGQRVRFERVVWLSHSLGTIVSYNALSALFHRADRVGVQGDPLQREGVDRFRRSLRRFVTMGSPLDKVAFLFGERAIRSWPAGNRLGFLEGGEPVGSCTDSQSTEWWTNFYHVLDPFSGALENPEVHGGTPPVNIHIRSGWIPGWAHMRYWEDLDVTRFLMGRVYGAGLLADRPFPSYGRLGLHLVVAVGNLIWLATLLVALAALAIWCWHGAMAGLEAIKDLHS